MTVAERFLKYIAVDTTSDPSSETFPSTKSQIDFANMLAEEMKTMGLENVTVDSYGYVFGTIPSTIDDYQGKILGFISHMDTSCAESGKNIRPRIIKDYDGKDIVLNEERKIVMSPRDFSNLAQYQGQDLIVTDGTTLLGGDDKAGIAEILTAAEYLLALDIVSSEYMNLDEKQMETEDQQWLMENSWKYGFILRYPLDKSDITGIIFEPWHYRYVGKEAAKEIYEQDITLEEYLGAEPVGSSQAIESDSEDSSTE